MDEGVDLAGAELLSHFQMQHIIEEGSAATNMFSNLMAENVQNDSLQSSIDIFSRLDLPAAWESIIEASNSRSLPPFCCLPPDESAITPVPHKAARPDASSPVRTPLRSVQIETPRIPADSTQRTVFSEQIPSSLQEKFTPQPKDRAHCRPSMLSGNPGSAAHTPNLLPIQPQNALSRVQQSIANHILFLRHQIQALQRQHDELVQAAALLPQLTNLQSVAKPTRVSGSSDSVAERFGTYVPLAGCTPINMLLPDSVKPSNDDQTQRSPTDRPRKRKILIQGSRSTPEQPQSTG